ncbi:hypothetical protein B447_15034 [Thauera sp. 27]|uniref:hypothetical protein n=1 Tax=Thauera sp. 27 TaxID=305700 RepID=UPI0002CFEC34|nr:hypothetical protein [Thauera sp. 27]ENO78038.1 hypothetical protein B447_15034 [Thauera sp. 27]
MINKLLVGVIAAFIATGCTKKEDVPSEKLSADVIRPIAESFLLPGTTMTDYKRENGWVDTQSPNQYMVRYTYNITLTKPLPEAILELAQQYMKELDESKRSPGLMGINSMQTAFAITAGGTQWVSAQGDAFAQRRDALLGQCAPCISFWNGTDGDKDSATYSRSAYSLAWSQYEELGFKDTAAVGDGVPRRAWAPFMKTENGWAAVQ